MSANRSRWSLTTPQMLVLALGASLTLGACRPPGNGGGGWGAPKEEGDTGGEVEPTPVLVAPLERGDIAASITASSTIEAERNVTVHAESTGRLTRVAAEEGSDVKEGAVLARIRADAQSSGLQRAEANLRKTKTDLATLENLHKRNVASDEELRAAQVAYDNAVLDVSDRRRELRNTKVMAPFSGTITERFVGEGAFVSSGAQLFSIVDFDTLVARVYVPERELDRLKVGQPAEVVGKAAKGRQGTGRVERIAPIVDANTGTVKITVSLPKAEGAREQGFLPGMYAEVTLETERHDNVLLVPKRALTVEDGRPHVFVVDGGHAKQVPLELGLSDAEQYEVLGGLKGDENIVIAGHQGLKDGAEIRRVDEDGNPVEQAGASGTIVSANGPDETTGAAAGRERAKE